MKSNLLHDVVYEGDYADFRAQLEQRFCTEVRRRNWKRYSAWVSVAATIALIAMLAFRRQPPVTNVATQKFVAPRDAVPTITTSMMKFNDLVISRKDPVPVIRTQPLAAEVIATDRSRSLPSVSDDELLRLFPRHPTGLMAAHGEKRLIFLDPADAKRFMSSN
jgi:hypothetical protein